MNNTDLRRSFFVTCFVAVFLFSMSPLSYAAELPEVIDSMQVEGAADVVEDVVGTEDVGEVEDAGKEYIDDSGDVITSIPKDPARIF